MRRLLCLTLLSVAMCLVADQSGVAATKGEMGRTLTLTRLVVLFSGLEQSLSKAVQQHDKRVLSKLLSKDFEMRVGVMPGNPIPRAAWIRQSFAEPLSFQRAEQMAVHGMGNVAIASYLWSVRLADAARAERVFVVDVWKKQQGHWTLAVRYADTTGEGRQRVPGVPASVPTFQKKAY